MPLFTVSNYHSFGKTCWYSWQKREREGVENEKESKNQSFLACFDYCSFGILEFLATTNILNPLHSNSHGDWD